MTARSFAIARKLASAIGNWCVAALLRSPFHRLLSRSMLLISVAGRRSGKTYTLPVNYVHDGKAIVIVSQADRSWWRNLRDGAPVWVRVQGKDLAGYAESFETPETVATGLLVLLQRSPAFRRHCNLTLTADGQLECFDNLSQLAQGRVVVRITELVAKPAMTRFLATLQSANPHPPPSSPKPGEGEPDPPLSA